MQTNHLRATVPYLSNERDHHMNGLDAKISVSSTKSTNFKSLKALGRSLIKIKKRIGPKLEPCGTPNLIILGEDKDPLQTLIETFH